jgi:hypothetical protein
MPMHQIVPYGLWIGHAGDGRDYRRVMDTGMQAIVQLAVEEPPLQPPRDLIYCRFPLVDGSGNSRELLATALRTVVGFLEAGLPALLSCSAGMSRSPAVAAMSIAVFSHRIPQECLELVVRQHPADLSPGLWNEMMQALAASGQ